MSTPIFDPDDPRLTAYALGECTAEDGQAVELILAASPEARAAVELTRDLARGLEADFASERAAYLQTHPVTMVATNVVAFPARRRPLRAAVAWTWKMAAVFLAVAAVALFVKRQAPPPPVASARPGTLEMLTPVAPLEERYSPPAAPPPAAPVDSSPLVASVEQEPPTDAISTSSTQEPLQGKVASSARASVRRNQALDRSAAPFPGSARPAPAAAAPMASASSPVERLAAALVRIRLTDGTMVGGVLLTADGRIVTKGESSAHKGLAFANVLLADGREFPVKEAGAELSPGIEQVRVTATMLPHTTLATNAPMDGSHLVAVHFDKQNGFASYQSLPVEKSIGQSAVRGTSSDIDLLFNDTGELLTTYSPATSKASAPLTGPATRPAWEDLVFVRPFTAAERAKLRAPAK